jgi:tetratricopeptide (TPR) repeat protein
VETLEALARTLLASGQSPQAVEMAQRALELRQKAFPEASPEVGRSLQFLGDIQHAAGSSKDRESYEAAAKIRERLLGPDLFSNIPILAEAARTDLALGRFAEAGKLLDRVLALRKKHYGPQHPLVAFDLEAQADLEAAQGRTDKARSRLQEAKTILVKVLGPGHSMVLGLDKKIEGSKKK